MNNTSESSPLIDNGNGLYERRWDYPPFPEFQEGYLPDSVTVHFHFSPHRTAEQFDGAHELLKSADVFIPEAAGWTERVQKDFTAISRGDAKKLTQICSAQQAHDNTGFAMATYKSLYNTYKPVVLIDADSSRKDLGVGDFRKRYARVIQADVESTLQGFADVIAEVSNITYRRDLVMGENLGPKVTELVARHPRLVSRDRVQVLMTLGFTHTQLYEALLGSALFGDQVVASFWTGMTSVDIESRITNEYKSGRAPTRGDLEEFLIAYALGSMSVPRLDKRPLYDFNNPYLRSRDAYSYVGDIMIRMFQAMGDEGLSMAHRILLKTPTGRDEVTIASLAQAALNEANALHGSS